MNPHPKGSIVAVLMIYGIMYTSYIFCLEVKTSKLVINNNGFSIDNKELC